LHHHIHWTGAFARGLGRFGSERLFDASLDSATNLGKRMVALLLRWGLRGAIAAVVAMFIVATLSLLGMGSPPFTTPREWRLEELVLVLLILGGGLGALWIRTPLTAMASIGAAGLGLALLFAVYGAPDLAMTQIMVEVLTLIVVLLVLRRAPALAAGGGWTDRAARAVVALAVGAMMTLMTLEATKSRAPADTANYYREESYPAAQGRNVVNTILVDFRALDTMGEVLVVAAAGLGVLVLLGKRRGATGRKPS
jgi:multicomponent Na+:H+ antiporter subunit A